MESSLQVIAEALNDVWENEEMQNGDVYKRIRHQLETSEWLKSKSPLFQYLFVVKFVNRYRGWLASAQKRIRNGRDKADTLEIITREIVSTAMEFFQKRMMDHPNKDLELFFALWSEGMSEEHIAHLMGRTSNEVQSWALEVRELMKSVPHVES